MIAETLKQKFSPVIHTGHAGQVKSEPPHFTASHELNPLTKH